MAQAPPLTLPIRRRGRPGARKRGESSSSPPASGRANSVPDAAVTDGVQRGATGTPIVTSDEAPTRRRRPRAARGVVAGQGFEPWKASADGFTVRCASATGPRRTDKARLRPITATRALTTVDRFPACRAVCGPSQRRNNWQQRDDADQPVISGRQHRPRGCDQRLLGLSENLVSQGGPCPRRAGRSPRWPPASTAAARRG